jgi:hypothetical protein
MKGKTKAAAYGVATVTVALLAFGYFRAHASALRQPPTASSLQPALYLVSLLVVLGAAALMGALDLKRSVKRRTERWLLQAASPVEPVPEIQQAEQARAAGEPLEAVRLLREFLQGHPYELHAMSRIAEIYRYDLKNDLAAALEYEEMLKHPLPDDQWSWAALHLAKLYGRLNELDKSVALLERIDSEFGHTVAGRRAKQALERVRNPAADTFPDEETEADS